MSNPAPQSDPAQMNNLLQAPSNSTSAYPSSTTLLGRPLAQLTARLDALLLELKTCRGASACTQPWDALLPGADVHTLAEAMNPRFDNYFESLPRVAFDRCEEGYIVSAEGPMWTEGLAYGGKGKRDWVWDVNALARKGRHALNRP